MRQPRRRTHTTIETMRDILGRETRCLTYGEPGCGLRIGKTNALVLPLVACPQWGAEVAKEEARRRTECVPLVIGDGVGIRIMWLAALPPEPLEEA